MKVSADFGRRSKADFDHRPTISWAFSQKEEIMENAVNCVPHPKMSAVCEFTLHARNRMNGRRIGCDAVNAFMAFGRCFFTRRAVIFVNGKKEVRECTEDVSVYEGIHVICAHDGTVLTVYRNHDLRRLRPHRRTHLKGRLKLVRREGNLYQFPLPLRSDLTSFNTSA